jgi:hypothetical protein
MTPDINYGENCSIPPMDTESERIKLQARIEALEADLAILNKGKDAAERLLKYEREKAKELAQNSALSLKCDWIAMINELRILKGETIGDDPKDNEEYQESLAIDFVNRLRMGALASVESDDDETLYVKARAYEVWYRACTSTLQNRIQRIRIEKSGDFEAAKLKQREAKVQIAKEKLEKRRRTPEEKIIEDLMTLGMSESQAKAHLAQMNAAAKQMKTQ